MRSRHYAARGRITHERLPVTKKLADAVSEYGANVKANLTSPAITGAPEDQLRAPLERFLKDLSEIAGLPSDALQLVGETSLAGLGIRPDYAAALKKALVGFVEVKAPGKGADPRHFSTHTTRHNGKS